MPKVTLNDVGSGHAATSLINGNNATIETAFDNTLSRDGSTPNAMGADLDMNGNDILNISEATIATINGVDATVVTGLDAAVAAAEAAQAAAETAQGLAETAQTSAEAVFDQFDDRYLGSKASAPTLDNDGNALQDGALYYDTTLNVLHVYDLGTTTWISLPVTLLGSMTDVTLTSIASGEILKWDGSKWINNTLAEAGIEPAFSKNTGFNLNLGTTAGTVSEGNHTHTGTYEPADATILKSGTTANLTAGYTTDIHDLGSTVGITPDLTAEWLKSATITGNLTINEVADGNEGGCIIYLTTSGGPYTVTLGSGVYAIGTIPDLEASTTYECRIVKLNNFVTTVEIIKVEI